MKEAVPGNKRSRFTRILIGGLATLAAASAFAGSATYVYDNLGRVTRVTYSNGVIINYTYDAAGNRSTYVVTGAPS
jgi:YD repeat-containing protein